MRGALIRSRGLLDERDRTHAKFGSLGFPCSPVATSNARWTERRGCNQKAAMFLFWPLKFDLAAECLPCAHETL